MRNFIKNCPCQHNSDHGHVAVWYTLLMFDAFYLLFPVSGVKTYLFLPPLVAMVISFFTSMGGLSGAFLLLPFQMSVLGFTSPSVSSTNLVFNIVAIPGGVYRYIREGRMAWPLTAVIVLGTLPGVFLGYYLRVVYLPDPRRFKLFVGFVLLYVAARLISDVVGRILRDRRPQTREKREVRSRVEDATVRTIVVSPLKVEYEFRGDRYAFSTAGMFLLALVVGAIGGVYGIGGGAIIAPFCIAVFGLPVYTVAGATLMGTFLTSVAGISFYSLVPLRGGATASPDWLLGTLFGIGGLAGMYLGARAQKHIPQKVISALLGLVILFLAVAYISQYYSTAPHGRS